MQIDLNELVAAGVIPKQVAENIQSFYRQKQSSSPNRLLVAFGVLGALLVGLGIILIIAHNWDELQRWFKTVLAFIPLLIGQALCAFALSRKPESIAWREGTSAFLFLAVGANISLLSQIYHLGGSISSFLLTWMLICLPIIYAMRSSVAALLYLAGITYYVCETGYWASYDGGNPFLYWLLLLLMIPHYLRLIKENSESNFTAHHHRWVVLSVAIALGTVAKSAEEWMAIAYISLFSLMILIGGFLPSDEYKKTGSLGIVAAMLLFSFKWFWESVYKGGYQFRSTEFFVAALISVVAIAAYFLLHRKKQQQGFNVFEIAFVWFIPIFITSTFSVVGATVLSNAVVLALGVITIADGARSNNLRALNFGLLIVTALVVCRFFDTNMSFVVRGILFVMVGVGFFVANYSMLKKRKADG